MFDTTSRYYRTPEAVFTTAAGERIIYKRRRFVPQGATLPCLFSVTVQIDDRLDLIAARTLGDPTLFWRICDANDAVQPADLTAQPGRTLVVPNPQP